MEKIVEKYGRLLAKIRINDKDIASELLNCGLARPYDGGTKDDTPLKVNKKAPYY